MTENAYIHIPFCKSKCKYCSFISYPKLELKEQYLKTLKDEIKYFYKGEKLNTLYFGGGTPSLLKVDEFKALVKMFNFKEDAEVTAELNPETVTYEYLLGLKLNGINRISFGCQTFNDNILKNIGRRHSSFDVKNSIQNAQKAGFDNISIDFIYGLPNQTDKDFQDDLDFAVTLGIQHISLYGLKIDEGCYFYSHIPENLPDDDSQADMYLNAIDILTNNDFEHYEVSNFAKTGFYSRHNLNYWDNNSYYGFGVGAHGYEDEVRYYNTSNLEEYIQYPIVHKNTNTLSKNEKLEEEIFLGFRKASGININKINKKFGIDFNEKYKNTLKKYENYFSKTNTGYKLTKEGILISNVILAEFLE